MFPLPICVIMEWVMDMEENHVGATSGRPQRKKNRLDNYDYSSCGAYFITVCTLERRNYFWENVGAIIDRPQNVELSPYGKMVDNAIQSIPSAYPALSLESYVIMPNHIHLLLRVCADEYYNVAGYKTTERHCCKTSRRKHLAKIVSRSHYSKPRGLRRTFALYIRKPTSLAG